MKDDLATLIQKVVSEVPNPIIDWKPFFDDARMLELYAMSGEESPGDVFSAIDRIETTISDLVDKPLHELEKAALDMGRFVARGAWLRLKGQRKGWTEGEIGFVQRFDEEQDDLKPS